MTIAEPAVAAERPQHSLVRYARPLLGLALPVGLAALWEIAVRMGLSDGRLVPPPSRIYQEFAELWQAGELQRHLIATVLRVIHLGVIPKDALARVQPMHEYLAQYGLMLRDPTCSARRTDSLIAPTA